MVSPEGLTVINLPSVDSPEGMNVTVRGLLPIGVSMRDLKVEAGVMFKPGLRQVIVGDAIARRYPGAQIGKQIRFGRGIWEVVGVFSCGDSAANSEIWTDLDQLRGDFERQGGSSSLLIRLTDAEAARSLDVMRKARQKSQPEPKIPDGTFMKSVTDDQRLGSSVMGEKEYYEAMTSAGAPLQALGFSVAIIMAIGSAFAATNTMYAAVSRRSREVGTMRALGFGRFSILKSFMIESICLALLGGLIGVLITLPINGLTTGVGSFVTFSETAFKFRITPVTMIGGLIFAALIGALGGFLPAWSASKKSIVQTMREG
jgi:putative ABC transport system permease protein